VVSRNLGIYVFIHFLVLLLLATAALFKATSLGQTAFTSLAILIVASLVVLSGLLEQKRWARPMEAARLLLLLVLGGLYGPALVRLIGNA
jgi:surface polysaccharide O-acyltransferase-like enzyme